MLDWCCQHCNLKLSLSPFKSRLASRSGECHSSHTNKTAQVRQRVFRYWGSGGGSRGRRGRLGNTPLFPQSRARATRLRVGASPAGSRSAQVPLPRRCGRRRIGGGAGRAWWPWEWLGEEVLKDADGHLWMGDDWGIQTALLKRCQKNSSRLLRRLTQKM